MCSIVGAVLREPSDDDLAMLRRVFLESQIRGKHATGVAYVQNGSIHIDKRPISAQEFPFEFGSYQNEDGHLYLIGHCRYSTSDLQYNQPLGNESKAIVHNGVITQELPERWKTIYGYACDTKNDSELILHSDNPLAEFNHMSMGVCELYADKRMRIYRNGKRPLYVTVLPNDRGVIVTSTADIARRARIDESPVELVMNQYVSFDEHIMMSVERIVIDDAVDLQHYALC